MCRYVKCVGVCRILLSGGGGGAGKMDKPEFKHVAKSGGDFGVLGRNSTELCCAETPWLRF